MTNTRSDAIKGYFTDKDELKVVELVYKEKCAHDCHLFRFQWSDADLVSGVSCGEHVKIYAEINGKSRRSSYTPISDPQIKGDFEFVIKVYVPTENSPMDGQFSRHIDSYKIGDKVQMAGPTGKTKYLGDGLFSSKHFGITKKFGRIGMITGGVGITPMLSIIRRVFGAYEKTEVSLFYSNKTEKDILFREELDECAKEHPQQFNLYLTLTQADTELVDWKNFTGRFDKDILSKVMPSIEDGCSEDVLILVSGQKKMIKSAWHLCEQLGYANIWKC